MFTRSILILCALSSASCTYLEHASHQAEYTRIQEADPSQRNLKHMIERENFAVIGQTFDDTALYQHDSSTKAVAAFSSRFVADELVDVMHDISTGTHFGLNLPGGDYRIVVLADRDGDGHYRHDEAIGSSELSLSRQQFPSLVVPGQRVALRGAFTVDWHVDIEVSRTATLEQSLFYPAGTIRTLADPIFSPEMSTVGLYDPAAFFEQIPTMFYALEEDIGHKIPVIFVHGIGGSAREFELLVEQVDRSRFKPWFFQYASGGDLGQMAQLFHDIFLSGDRVRGNEYVPMVIVAHSMGGLVVREALNLWDAADSKIPGIEFISLATPFGGHPSARFPQDSALLILPSWRDLNPDSAFVQQLFRRPLPARVRHTLMYAFENDSALKLGANSDGVVPLWSQLRLLAQEQASAQLGLNVTHVSILTDPAATAVVIEKLATVKTRIPNDHFAFLLQGGFEVEVGDIYDRRDQYYLRYYGRYIEALALGRIEPLDDDQAELLPMLRGQAKPTRESARSWLKFTSQNPGQAG